MFLIEPFGGQHGVGANEAMGQEPCRLGLCGPELTNS